MPIAAVVVLWLALAAWRPLVLGFYHDDWWALARPIERTPLVDLLDGQRSRALAALLVWSLRHLLNGVAALWQALAAAIDLAGALSVYALVCRMDRRAYLTNDSGMLRWAGVGASAVWLSAPWSLAYTAWPVMAVALMTIPLLAASTTLLLTAKPSSTAAGAAAALPYLVGALIYEAIWGAFAPVALIAGLLRLKERASLRPILAYALVAGAGQIVILVANRLLSVGSHAKQVSAVAAEIVGLSFQIALPQIAESIGAPLPVAVTAAVVLVGAFAMAASRSGDVLRLGIVAACLLGTCIAMGLHAAAGYGTQWTDLMARTAMVPTFWLCVAVGAMLQAILAQGPVFRATATIAGAAFVAALSIATLGHTSDWAAGWRQQRALLSTFPAEDARQLPPGTVVVADLPRDGSPRGQFDAYWDVTGALVATYPDLAHLFVRGGTARATVLRPRDWFTHWDGSKLSQGWCPDRLLWSFSGTGAFLWNQRAGTLTPIEAGTRFGCEK